MLAPPPVEPPQCARCDKPLSPHTRAGVGRFRGKLCRCCAVTVAGKGRYAAAGVQMFHAPRRRR